MAEKPQKRQRNVSEGFSPGKRRSRRSEEGLLSKRESDRRRGQTRITIGVAFPRWRALKKELGLRADSELALLLLNSYEENIKGPFASTPNKVGGDLHPLHHPSLSSNGPESQRIEWNDTLPSSCSYEGAAAHDEELSNTEEDTDCSDEDYGPSLCERTVCALRRTFTVQTLPTSGNEEIMDQQLLGEEDVVDLPQQHNSKDEELLADQQLCNQNKNSSLDQEDQEPSQIKEEPEELCVSLDKKDPASPQIKEEQVELCISLDQDDPDLLQIKEEQEELCISLDRDDPDLSQIKEEQEELCTGLEQDDPDPPQIKEEQEELCTGLDPDDLDPPQIKEEQEEFCTGLEGDQLVLKQETETFILTPTCEENSSEDQTLKTEPNSDDHLLSHKPQLAENQHHEGGKHGDSGSTINAESKLQTRPHNSNSDNVCNSNISNIQLNTHTGKKVLFHKCDTCGKAFKNIYQLNRHQTVHTGEKPYPCNICEKRFSQLGNLKEHMKVHTGEKPYPCNTCEKRFFRLDTLKEHMRVHTGEKPYQCNSCEKRFSQLGNLKEHIRVHTGEKPYQCNTCEKRFSHLRILKKHMRVHTGEKPYPCNTCGKRFSHRGNLKEHIRVHTGEKPYNCKICGSEFRHGYQLNGHMRTHILGEDFQMPDLNSIE